VKSHSASTQIYQGASIFSYRDKLRVYLLHQLLHLLHIRPGPDGKGGKHKVVVRQWKRVGRECKLVIISHDKFLHGSE